MTPTYVQTVMDTSQVAEARRSSVELCRRAMLNDEQAGKVALVVTEGANNVLKHGGSGHVLMRVIPGRAESASPLGVEVLCLDKGPGIADLRLAMSDGFSTAGTMGQGLGAMQRASSVFDIFSAPGKGAAVLCQVLAADPRQQPHSPRPQVCGAISVPVHGETVCGDGFAVEINDEGTVSVIMIDGLGHGALADRAARTGIDAWRKDPFRAVEEIMPLLDGAMRSTRGGAGAAAHIYPSKRLVRFSGVGNIAGLLLQDDRTQHTVSLNGTLGFYGRAARVFDYAWSSQSTLVLHSDGLATRWAIADYPGLGRRHPALLAGVVYRDYQRGRDDATIVAIGERA